MNGKMKALVALTLVMGVTAAVFYAVPIMAQQNGTLDQERIRECQQNHQCHQFQYEECLEHTNSTHNGGGMMNMMGVSSNSHCQNQERGGMGRGMMH